MFEFETVVLTMVIGLIAPNISAASDLESLISNQGCGAQDAQAIAALGDSSGMNQDQKDAAKASQEFCHSNLIKSGGGCQDAPGDFKKALEEFNKDCKEANISGGDCAKEVNKCIKAGNGNDSDTSDDDDKRNSNAPLDVNGVAKKCPSMAATDLEKFEKQLKEQKDKVEKLNKELPDLQDKADKIISDTNDKLQEMTQQAAKDQADHAKELKEASRSKDAAMKAITDQLAAVQVQISKAKDALSQVALTKLDGQMKMKQAKVQAQLNCHASASDQVGKLQADVIAKIQAGTYNRGGFTSFMKNVGVSDRAQWQRVALKYYRWCLESKPTMDTIDAANDGYKLVLAQANAAQGSIKDQISQLQTQQLQLSNPAGCQAPGPSGISAVCQAAQQAQEDMQQSEADFNSKRQANQQKYESIAKQGQNTHNSMIKQISDKKREISDETERLNNLQDYLDAKYDRGGTSDHDSKAVAGAMAQLASVQDDAKTVIDCARQNATGNKAIDFCTGNAICTSAVSFIKRTESSTLANANIGSTTYTPDPLVQTKAPPSSPRAPAEANTAPAATAN